MEKFESLEKAMCMELETLEQKMKAGSDMSMADLEKIDKLAHAMKSLATYKAMKEAEEYTDNVGGMSGYRGRAMNGRFVSRDEGNQSYAEGYSRGYAEGRSQAEQNRSGYYMPPHW